jgi:Trypsin-co-occurring domain 1
MSGPIRAGGATPHKPRIEMARRRLVPIQIGSATAYLEQFGEPAVVESEGRIRTVAPSSPGEAFETGGEILRECVRIIGERIEAMADRARPQRIAVEFSLSFEVKGKASIIPVFLTGETAGKTGLKITAEWTRTDTEQV